MSGNPGTHIPPHSVEAEQAILGGLMIDPEAWDKIEGRIHAADFFRFDHRMIFDAIAELRQRGDGVDFLTVAHHLGQLGQLEDAGGMPYLGDMAAGVPSTANIASHARIVKDAAIQRDLSTLAESNRAAIREGRTTAEILADTAARLSALEDAHAAATGTTRDLCAVLTTTVEGIEDRYENRHKLAGLSTGFLDLDHLTHGMQKGDLIVLGARPSMGKTAFALSIAMDAAIRKTPALFVSMEMPSEQLGLRLLSMLGRINMQTLLSGRMQDEDWPRLTDAVSTLTDAPLTIDDRSAPTVAEIRAAARRIEGLGLIVIDYLGLMTGEGENPTIKMGAIARGCKQLARDMRVPVLLLSQLNRGVEQRPNKRPMMADLRDSGEIEQHADLIWFLYRDEVYNPDTPEKGVAELNVAKQRNGPIGLVRLTFRGAYTAFTNYQPDVYGATT